MAFLLDVRSFRLLKVVLLAGAIALGVVGTSLAAAPTATVAPTITGGTHVLDPVTCTTGSWDQAASFTYGWFVDGVRIDGADAADFTLRGIDRGRSVTCQVTATTPEPAATTATSAAIIPLPAIQTVTGALQLATGQARSCGVTLGRPCSDARRGGGKVRVGGVLAPARPGARVIVIFERQRDSHWVLSMTRTARIAADGSYFVAIPANFFSATTWRVRTRVPETDVYATAASQFRFERITH